MKRKKKKIIFEAAGLLLAFMFIVSTGLQSTVAVEINPTNQTYEYLEKKEPVKIQIKNLVIGKGEMEYIFPKNLDNFEGEYWRNDSNVGYRKVVKGWIKNTDIEVGNYPAPGGSIWVLLIIPRLLLPKGFIIKNFTGWIYCNFYYSYHGPWGADFTILGISDGIQNV
ncbi:hypothetical protein MBGDN05_00049 [Thermoplasmatales archaeon SCGC AB-539-N05]|nr:hypothetical protein MBGDN05_00049 [Thermoplasmatales archaeon SCGC AB-539-N05]